MNIPDDVHKILLSEWIEIFEERVYKMRSRISDLISDVHYLKNGIQILSILIEDESMAPYYNKKRDLAMRTLPCFAQLVQTYKNHIENIEFDITIEG